MNNRPERTITKHDGYCYMGYAIAHNDNGTEYWVPGLIERHYKSLDDVEQAIACYWNKEEKKG